MWENVQHLHLPHSVLGHLLETFVRKKACLRAEGLCGCRHLAAERGGGCGLGSWPKSWCLPEARLAGW
jgi:hypothetical protein